jgi:hypothetical protein
MWLYTWHWLRLTLYEWDPQILQSGHLDQQQPQVEAVEQSRAPIAFQTNGWHTWILWVWINPSFFNCCPLLLVKSPWTLPCLKKAFVGHPGAAPSVATNIYQLKAVRLGASPDGWTQPFLNHGILTTYHICSVISISSDNKMILPMVKWKIYKHIQWYKISIFTHYM